MSGTFKQVSPLKSGELEFFLCGETAELWQHGRDSEDDVVILNYDNAVKARDWLIAATGGEGPEGWQLVPVAPTDKQCMAAYEAVAAALRAGMITKHEAMHGKIEKNRIRYRAMLSAAPQVGDP